MQDTTIAVDLAKSVFEVAISHTPGRVSERHRLTRRRFAGFLAETAPATVVMEACGSAHFWAREAEARGHTVRLLPAQDVARRLRGNKTDRNDAKAMLEAHRDEDVNPVPVKTVDQQAMLGLHRVRQAWMATRTSRINTLRGVLRELGVTIPIGAGQAVRHVWAQLSDADSPIPESLRPSLASMATELAELEERIATLEGQLKGLARESEPVRRLQTIPGVGLLTATALVASIGDFKRFPTGRHFASSLGLTPREHSSGSRRRLGAITKRGDVYLRTLLIHGARSVLHHAKRMENPDRLRAWAVDREKFLGHNKAAVAVANKLARTAWAVSVRCEAYALPSADERR
jgi:transposase